ncbi:MAG: radical SAM protein [Acidobacteriota bacterium]
MANDRFYMDSHKLIFHPERVSDWLNGKCVYPLTVEICPSQSCNHRCLFCAFDYREYKPVLLDKSVILPCLEELAQKGVKSIIVSGEGEPLVNKFTPEMIKHIKHLGMDAAMSSNGVLFTKDVAQECLSSLTWVRFSVNAGSSTTHYKVHKGKADDYDRVISNIAGAVEFSKAKQMKTTIGIQMLLIPENINEVTQLARTARDIGVDYLTIKPFSQHPMSINNTDAVPIYQDSAELGKQLSELATPDFQIIFRSSSMSKLQQPREYDQCRGLPFWAYIGANGDVSACLAFIGDDRFCYGNLNENSFSEIWEGPRRAEVRRQVSEMDLANCRELCRLDEINRYLHQLVNPGEHVNFV